MMILPSQYGNAGVLSHAEMSLLEDRLVAGAEEPGQQFWLPVEAQRFVAEVIRISRQHYRTPAHRALDKDGVFVGAFAARVDNPPRRIELVKIQRTVHPQFS